ncbi:MAG: proton-conducting transporter membrane subunit, partial [Pseudomonadota bacterium]
MAGASETTGQPNGFVSGYLPVLVSAALFAYFLGFIPEVAAGNAVIWSAPWIPSLGIELAFMVDGLSLTFALLISGIGALVLLYSNTYLEGHVQYARFSLFLTAFMLSMLGLVLADDLIFLFVFWELTTLTSYMLIGFSHTDPKSRRNALQALFVTGAGALAFLAGLILLGHAAGTLRLSEIITMGPMLTEHPLYLPILILLFCGALTKSAQVPFHFWLPNAMAAPTPVSAFLHSATMVKAGVFFLARMHPALSGTAVWFWTLVILGSLTAVFASIQSLRQSDLKQALAYTTLMALGTLTLFLGQTSGYAMTAFATFLVVHSLYKAALFLVVGCIDHATGTREAEKLAGLGRLMPVTALAAALAALSMAGIPPLLGFIAKELMYAGAVEAELAAVFITGAALAANALMFAVAGVVALRPFWSGRANYSSTPHEAPWQMLTGPLLLAILGTVFGIFPGLVQDSLITPTVVSLLGTAEEAKTLKLWAGVNLPLFLSIATFLLGGLIYATHRSIRAALQNVFAKVPSLDLGWDHFMEGLKSLAAWQTRIIQTGRMSDYLLVTFATIAIGLGTTLAQQGMPIVDSDFNGVGLPTLAIFVLLAAGALLALVTSSRIAGIAALGVVGIATALIFILFSAPDVAITQLLVETLVVVLVAVVML